MAERMTRIPCRACVFTHAIRLPTPAVGRHPPLLRPSTACRSFSAARGRGHSGSRHGDLSAAQRVSGRERAPGMTDSSLPQVASTVISHAFLRHLEPGASSSAGKAEPFALVVVNGDVGHFLAPLWTNASLRVCADGGANRVYHGLPAALRESVLPSALVGDFDSVEPSVLSYYRDAHSVATVHSSDENSTDLQKALSHLRTLLPASSAAAVVIYAAFGGRFDQLMQNVHTLRSYGQLFPHSRVVLLSEGNLVTLLAAGRPAQYRIAVSEVEKGSHCGLFALGERVRGVRTAGLRWNLQGTDMQWEGGKGSMSTNNLLDAAEVLVSVEGSDGDADLVWTTECGAVQAAVEHAHSDRASPG